MGIKNLLLQVTSGKPEGTGVIRLTFKSKPDPQNPGSERVALDIITRWANKAETMDFWFDFPVLAEPFA